MKKKLLILLALCPLSSPVMAGVAYIPVSLEIVGDEGVEAGEYPFDYSIWKTQCCKQLAIGTVNTFHYNCQALQDDGRLENCKE